MPGLSEVCNTSWAPKPDEQPEVFQYIGRGAYVYSAYYDGRDNQVKVTALMPRSFDTNISCLLWYKESEHPQVMDAVIRKLDPKG